MEKGKFSQPRPYRDEERQIEEAFRQITEQGGKKQPYQPKFAQEPVVTEDTMAWVPEEDIPEELPLTAESDYLPPEETVQEIIPPKSVKNAMADFLFSTDEPIFEEEEPYEEDTAEAGFLDKILLFCDENRKWVMTALCAFALLLIVSIISVFAFGGSSAKESFTGNLFIAGTNINGMTKKQAISSIKNATVNAYKQNPMIVELAGTKLELPQKKTGANLDVEAVVNAAFQADQEISQQDDPRYVALLPYLNLNTDYIRQELDGYAEGAGSTLTQTSYGLEGAAPKLGVEDFNENTAQTLVITMGTPGISFDVDAVYDQILDAYSMFQFSVAVTDVEPTVEPDSIDLQDVYEEFYIEPVDSTINMQTFEVIPGSYGYEFDLMAAQKQLEQAQFGDIIRIPMQFIEPKQLDEDVLFRDILGEFQTALPDDRNITTNIRLACEALNGTVLEPGDGFSFNDTIGKPTSGKGYKTVFMQEGHEEIEVLGGGISQAATTLYNCALLADLEIVSRTNHSFPVDYVDYGLDAAVSHGGADLKFRNNQNYPISIEATVSGNYVTIRILGTDERDYYVRMESEITATHKPATVYEDFEYHNAEGYLDGDVIRKGINGYSVKTYKLKYDRQTGTLKTKDYEANSRYSTVDMLVARVEEPETTVPETTVPEPTVPPTTVPPTTVPPETTAPPTVPQETTAAETQPVQTEPIATDPVPQDTQPQSIDETTIPTEAETITE